MNDPSTTHWQHVYSHLGDGNGSWFQKKPVRSLELIHATGVPLTGSIIDVGGGASALIDHLLAAGHLDLAVLDIAANAFEEPRHRLGSAASRVEWIAANVTQFEPRRTYDIWHDRAVFHFLTDANDRDRYLERLRISLKRGGHFLLFTFGPEGPAQCSGLPVQRYSAAQVCDLLGEDFVMRAAGMEDHATPAGRIQQFLYGWWQRRA